MTKENVFALFGINADVTAAATATADELALIYGADEIEALGPKCKERFLEYRAAGHSYQSALQQCNKRDGFDSAALRKAMRDGFARGLTFVGMEVRD